MKGQLPSIVLGINDALIELTGALVGLSFALKNHELVALSGLITGVAAAFSMAASAYQHARQETDSTAPKVGIYTGASYLIVVALLVWPFIVFKSILVDLALMGIMAFFIIVLISWYSAKIQNRSFGKEFGIMLLFSLGVAIITFTIGQLAKSLL